MSVKDELRIVVVGGGSGGHITPLLAVAHELKLIKPDCEIIYIGQKGDSLGSVPANDPDVDKVYTVRAGKLRRYHGEGLRQLLDLPTLFKNLRDGWFVLVGTGQSYALLRRLKPQVIFTRGSFVSVPVALAAAALRIPYITHDSDAIPSLANRLIARWAAWHAVALPKEIYPYPQAKTITVGVPISHKYHKLDAAEKAALRSRLGLRETQKVVLVTGGGNGAQRLNNAVAAVAGQLLATYGDLVLIHLSGKSLEQDLSNRYDELLEPHVRQQVKVIGFTSILHEYSGIAEVIVARAGGTSMAEFAAQAKACVIVPNPQLTGGHQPKNAQVLADRQAIQVIEEAALLKDPQIMLKSLIGLLDDPVKAQQLGDSLYLTAQPDSAHKLARLLLSTTSATPADTTTIADPEQ